MDLNNMFYVLLNLRGYMHKRLRNFLNVFINTFSYNFNFFLDVLFKYIIREYIVLQLRTILHNILT